MALREPNLATSAEFVALYRRHVAYVWKSARRLGLTAPEADDVVQETFLTVLRLAGSYVAYGSERAERGWLFAVLFRVVQHYRRSHRRWIGPADAGVNVDGVADSNAAGPERCAEAREGARIREGILDGLDPDRRAVLVLSELEERPVSEIAEILGIKLNTAASRLRLAREQVEAAIARHRARDGWRFK